VATNITTIALLETTGQDVFGILLFIAAVGIFAAIGIFGL
jgi:hypothetical protein